MSDEILGVRAELDLSRWSRNVSTIISDTTRVDSSLDRIVNAANEAENALSGISGGASADISISVDDSQIVDAETAIEDIGSAEPQVDVSVDDEPIIQAADDVEAIDDTEPQILPFVDDEPIIQATEDVQAIDDVEPQVEVKTEDQDDSLQTISNKLDTIRNIGIISLTLNAIGNLPDILDRLEHLPGVNAVVDMQQAMAILEARTGQAGDAARTLIDDIYIKGFAQSRQQVAELVAEAQQLGVPLDQVATAVGNTLSIAKANGADASQTLQATEALMTSFGLSASEAGDLITAGFQNGANAGNDFLATVDASSTAFAGMNFTGEQFVGTLTSGMENGFRNTQSVAMAVKNLSNNVSDLNNNAAQTALTTIGAPTASQGQEMGAQFVDDVLTGVQNAAPEKQTELINALFGGRAGTEVGNTALLGIDPNTAFDGLEGSAKDAADAIQNTLGAQVNKLFETLDTKIGQFLSSGGLNLSQKIEEWTKDFQTFFDLINQGVPVGRAIEIAFKIPGFEDALGTFESAIGNLEIALLQAASSIASALGKTDIADSINQEITRLATGQFQFDLQLANNGADVATDIQTAVNRGVGNSTIGQQIGQAVQNALSTGNVNQAQTIINGAQSTSAPLSPEEEAQIQNRMLAFHQSYERAAQDLGITIPITTEVDTSASQASVDAAIQQMWHQAFTDLNSGDTGAAEAIADILADPALASRVNPELVAALKTQIQMAIDAAKEQYGREEAGRQTTRLDEADQNQYASPAAPVNQFADTMNQRLPEVQNQMGQTSDIVRQRTVDMGGDFSSLNTTGQTQLTGPTGLTNWWEQLQVKVTDVYNVIMPWITQMQQGMTDINSAAQNLSSTPPTGGGTGGTGGGAIGGSIASTKLVGEHGAELYTPDRAGYIINAANTDSILSALAGVLNGGSGQVNNNQRSTIFNQYVTVQSSAQAASTMQGVGNALRGFG